MPFQPGIFKHVLPYHSKYYILIEIFLCVVAHQLPWELAEWAANVQPLRYEVGEVTDQQGLTA